MTLRNILVVDDEAAIRQVLAAQLDAAGYVVEHVGAGEAAAARLAKGDIDLAICDIRLPDLSGIEVMRNTRTAGIETDDTARTAVGRYRGDLSAHVLRQRDRNTCNADDEGKKTASRWFHVVISGEPVLPVKASCRSEEKVPRDWGA